MGVCCPNCGSKSVDSKARKTMYNEIVQYYECAFCKIPFMVCRSLGKINRAGM